MSELRHIAMSVRDPWMTAEFYKSIFGLEVAGETDSSLAEGVFLTDGVFGIALLAYKSDEAAQGKGKDFVGLHHFGVWVDNVEATQKRIEAHGGRWIMGEPDYRHNAQYEVKFLDPNGVVLDLVHNGWAGTQRRPGQADNEVSPKRGLVERYAERRAKAAQAMAARGFTAPPQRCGEIRHFAMAVPDPWMTAEFYKRVFGFAVVGETDSSLAEGVFLSDGVIGLALLDYKSDAAAQGKGKDFVGLHHFGIWVDDVDATHKLIEQAGGHWIMGEPDYRHNAAYEVKFHDMNGVILDLVHNGWAGTQRRPGQADNAISPKRSLVPRFAERRARAEAAQFAALAG